MSFSFAKDAPEGFTNSVKKVAIVGAGGHIGKAIAENILKTRQHTVTAITRPNSNSPLPDGLEKAVVDYQDEKSLISALTGQDLLVITLSLHAPPGTHTALVKAASKAGVRYVMPNVYGINLATSEQLRRDLPVSQKILSNIAEVEEFGMISVSLMCGLWYEYSIAFGPSTFGFDFDNRTVVMYDDGKKVINTSTWAQCGRAVASLFSQKILPDDEGDKSVTISDFYNKILYVSSFKISQTDMFESVKRVTGTTDQDWKISHVETGARYREAMEELKQGKTEGFHKSIYARAFFPRGDADFEPNTDRLGLSVEDLDERTRLGITLKGSL
ncbi:CipA protein [Colletotrichum musicola]|uniref:CipA protein n=1 Tax=Colletotrichum musicola TaxID=2175873 RepID=A0A8H6IYT7_9PEZI|nr:CipA protein [Colletotrichum musicola]